MFERHSPRNAHIGLLVFLVVLVPGVLAIGPDASDSSYQALVVVAYAAGLVTLFWLSGRDERSRARKEDLRRRDVS